MTESDVWEGGCHCGRVRYRVKTGLERVMECNCSHCSKKAFLLTFVGADDFELLSGEDALSEYQFNKKVIHHLFCSSCGVESFGRGPGRDGSPMVMVNVRCLDGVDLAGLDVTQFDGKSL